MVTLRTFSHSFEIVTGDRRAREAIFVYFRTHLSTFKFGRGRGAKREIDRTFASMDKNKMRFRMHINFLTDFKRHMGMSGFPDTTWTKEEAPMYEPAKAKFKCIFPYPLRPKQQEIFSFAMAEQQDLPNFNVDAKRRSFIIPLQMGGGKTLIALYTAAQLQVRTMVVVSKRYMDNWLKNICGDEAKLDLKVEEVLVIRSTNDLKRLIKLYREKNPKTTHKMIVCSKGAITNFINAYIKGEDVVKDYGILPSKLYEHLKIGLVIRDEVHEEIHANTKQDIHKHVPMQIELSATLVFDDPKMEALCNTIFAVKDRYNAGEWNKYIDVRGLRFNLHQPTKLKWSQYKGGPYNHAEFEKSIMKYPKALERYKAFVLGLLVDYFYTIYEPGDKCAIYCFTVKMAEILADYISEHLPQYKTGKYTSDDDYEVLMGNDISFTTPGSAGTGVDIGGLRRVFLTIGIKSSQRNFQISGRLRELFDLDRNGVVRDTVFYYFVCEDIEQHLDYENHKRNLFRNRVKSHETIYTGFRL